MLEFDISEFLDEIRSLRVQLERSIEINSALRRQLQEQLQHDKDWAGAASPGRTTTINIHHVSPNAGDQVGTGGSSSRACDSGVKRKLDLSKGVGSVYGRLFLSGFFLYRVLLLTRLT